MTKSHSSGNDCNGDDTAVSSFAGNALCDKVMRVDAGMPVSKMLSEVRGRRPSHVAVMVDGRCVGVSSFQNANLSLGDACTEDLVEAHPGEAVLDTTSLDELGRLFANSDIETQVVQNVAGEFVGVVTRRSLLQALLNERQTFSVNAAGVAGETTQDPERATDASIRKIPGRDDSQESRFNEQQRYQTLVDASPYCIHEIDLNGRFLSMNQAGLDMIGVVDESSIVGSPYLNAIGDRDRERVEGLMEAAFAGEFAEFDFQGEGNLEFRSNFVPIRRADGKVDRLLGITRDMTELHRAVRDATDAETRLQTILETALDYITVMDLDGKFLYLNRVADGRTMSEIIGASAYDFIPPEYHDVYRGAVNRVVATKQPYQYELKTIGSDGSPLWLLNRLAPYIVDGKVTSVTACSIDITDRKLAEEELRKSKERLDLAVRGTSDGLWDWNIETGESYWSPRYMEILGYDENELDATIENFLGLIHEDDVQETEEALRRHLEEGLPYDCEYRMRTKKGDFRWMQTRGNAIRDNSGRPYRMTGSVRDITDRKLAEQEFRRSETRIRALLEGSPVCNKIIDLDSRLQFMSRAGREQLKIDNIEPFYGCSFPPDLYSDEMKKIAIAHLDRAKMGEACSVDCCVRDTEGNDVWYDTSFVPSFDQDGKVEYVIVTSVNITERRRAEEEARQHRDELAHVARISTMGEMATGIAHELNQPLAAMASYAFAAKMTCLNEEMEPEKLADILTKLEDQSLRAGEIVRRLRDFVAKAESARAPMDLNELIRAVVKFVEPDLHQARARLLVDLHREMSFVHVDDIQIQQVLVNLVRNALDAMRETPRTDRIVVIATRYSADGEPEVLVTDRGRGLTDEAQTQIFNAFFSTKKHGLGMGLAISRSIIEAHGGRLWAKSCDNGGATFGFSLPAARNSPRSAATAKAP